MAKISELIKILKAKGDSAGVRRAERIGDEAPYAAERIDADELRRALTMGDNAVNLAIIAPEDFRYLAEQLPQEYVDRRSTQKHIQDLQKIAQEQGFSDIPHLGYNEYPGVNELGVFGHEGRHRMRALENLGDEKALVRLIPRGDVREPLPRRSRSEFLQALAEKYGDPLYLDPESYNQQVIPMKSRLKGELERGGANFDMEEFRNKYGYTGRKPVQPFAGGGLAKFFSAVDEAVANLRQKKGTGEQMLKEIQKAPGVKKEELELRRLPERLAGQQKVTQEDIQAMLQAVPAPKVKLTQRGGKGLRPTVPDLYNWVAERPGQRGSVIDALERRGYEITQNPEDPQTIGFISPDGDIVGLNEVEDLLETEREMAVNARVEASRAYQVAADNLANMYEVDGTVKPQFRDQIEEAKRAADNLALEELEARELNASINETRRELQGFMTQWQNTVTGAAQTDGPKFEGFTTKGPKENYRELLIQLDRPSVQDSTKAYVNPSHFQEPDILVHARVDDRVGPSGEKILYVEEIQSDWHQDARRVRLEQAKENVKRGSVQDAIANEARIKVANEFGVPEDTSIPGPQDNLEMRRRYKEVYGEIEDAKIKEEAAKLPKDFGYKQMGTRVAPFSQTSHELAVKQILDTAANEGYDKVMFAPGSEQVKRYSLGEYFDELQVNSMETGEGTMYNLSGFSKDGKKIDRTFNKKDLIEHIGEDKAKLAIDRIEENRAAGLTDPALLTGQDLLLGGKKAQGKLKIYDEIIPGFVSKYAGKEFNVQPGRTSIQADPRDVDEMRRAFRKEQYDKKVAELKDLFDQGGMDPESEVEFMSILDEAARTGAKLDFRHGKAGREFLEQFAPVDERGRSDLDKLVSEELDPSSFDERFNPSFSRLDLFKIKFKDPVKQEKFDDWLYGVVMDRSTDPALVDREFGIWGQKKAQELIDAMGEDLYKDMPAPQRLEGTSIDITPEMREKIQTRGQPLFVVPPAAAGAAAVLSEEEEPVQEFKEAGRVEKKEGMAKEQFDSPFDESKRIGPKPGVSKGPAAIRSLTKILRGEDTEAKNLERQRIAGNVKAGEEFGEYMYDMIVPQAPWEVALEAAFFPIPRPLRKAALAVAGGMYDPEAEAGRLRLLHGSPSKLDQFEEGRDLWMTTDPEYALKRGFDKMRMARGAQGPAMVNQFGMEDTELMRLTDKYSPEDIEIARRAFSKLPQGREVTGEEIYEIASTNTGGAKAAALENVTRALGKKGYQVPPGADDKGEWYRVLDQTDLEPYGKGGIVDAIKGVMKMTDTPPDPSRRKAIGLREKIEQPGALTTVEKEVSASDLDTLQKAMGNVGQAVLNEPVSRREVLKRGALSTASNLIPGGGVLQQVAKEMAPLAIKSKPPEVEDIDAAKKIAVYAGNVFNNNYAAAEAFEAATKIPLNEFDNYAEEVDDLVYAAADSFNTEDLWSEIEGYGGDLAAAAKVAGLDIETVAKETGVPVSTVAQILQNDTKLIEELISFGQNKFNLRTGADIKNITDDEEFLKEAVQNAVKQFGNDAESIRESVHDAMLERWRKANRRSESDPVVAELGNILIEDELLDHAYEKGAGDTLNNIDFIDKIIKEYGAS